MDVALIIPQHLHISGFFPKASQGTSYRSLCQISLKFNKEAILPASVHDRATLNLGHIQVVIDEMGQHMVQGAALVRQLKAYADFLRILARGGENLADLAVGIGGLCGVLPGILLCHPEIQSENPWPGGDGCRGGDS